MREAGCRSSSVSRTPMLPWSILFRNRMRGRASSSSSRRITCSAGILREFRLAYHDHRVADRQRRPHVVDELDRSGAVEKGEPVSHVIDAADVRLNAHRVAAGLRARIADAGALADRPLSRQRPAARQYSLKKAGFAALKRSDNGNETRTGDAVLVMDSSQNPAPSGGARSEYPVAFSSRRARRKNSRRGYTRLSRSCRHPDMLARSALGRKTVRSATKPPGRYVRFVALQLGFL